MIRCMALLILVAFFSAAQAQSAAPATATLVAREAEHSFGKIPQGKPVYYNFIIENKSSQPLQLDNVTATCGCTTPEWSKSPIAPGGSTGIKVGFNAATEGPFDKMVIVHYNGGQTVQMKIKGTVWATPDGAAPPNAAVQFLKQQTQ